MKNNILIKGLVRDEKENPVANAVVSFSKSPVPQQDISILTDKEGKFVMSVSSEGSYQLGINADGFDFRKVDFETEGEDVTLNINLKKN